MIPHHEVPKRRKRSHLSERDCLRELRDFAMRVDRMVETSGPFLELPFAPHGQIAVKFLVDGGFGTAEGLFEAIRVLAGYKLPRTKPLSQGEKS